MQRENARCCLLRLSVFWYTLSGVGLHVRSENLWELFFHVRMWEKCEKNRNNVRIFKIIMWEFLKWLFFKDIGRKSSLYLDLWNIHQSESFVGQNSRLNTNFYVSIYVIYCVHIYCNYYWMMSDQLKYPCFIKFHSKKC